MIRDAIESGKWWPDERSSLGLPADKELRQLTELLPRDVWALYTAAARRISQCVSLRRQAGENPPSIDRPSLQQLIGAFVTVDTARRALDPITGTPSSDVDLDGSALAPEDIEQGLLVHATQGIDVDNWRRLLARWRAVVGSGRRSADGAPRTATPRTTICAAGSYATSRTPTACRPSGTHAARGGGQSHHGRQGMARVLVFGHEPGGGGQARCQATSSVTGRTLFFFDAHMGTPVGTFLHPPPQTATENCTWHNYNVIPLRGRHVLVAGNYQSGISVVDFTDPAHAEEIAYADPVPLDPATPIAGGDWSSYWYNGLIIYESDITRGLIDWNLSSPTVVAALWLDHLNPQTTEFTIA